MHIVKRTASARDKDLMIVPVSNYSFQRAVEGKFYAFPKSYGRDTSKKFIAFYRTQPVKAITHYARIKKVKIKPLKDFSTRDMLMMFGHRGSNEIVVFELDPLIKLETPVVSGKKTIQGCKYSLLDYLLKVKSLDDL